METSQRHSRRAGLVLLLAMCLAAVAVDSAIRPSSPDEFRKLLLWAQRAADRSIHKGMPIPDYPSLAELNEVDAEWNKQHRRRPSAEEAVSPKPTPAEKKSPKEKARSPSPPVWSHSLLADEMADPLNMRRLPAHEEYDRNERYSHSFLHGFSLGF